MMGEDHLERIADAQKASFATYFPHVIYSSSMVRPAQGSWCLRVAGWFLSICVASSIPVFCFSCIFENAYQAMATFFGHAAGDSAREDTMPLVERG